MYSSGMEVAPSLRKPESLIYKRPLMLITEETVSCVVRAISK